VSVGGTKVGRRRGVIIGSVGSNAVRLAVHASLTVWAEAPLSIARVVLLVVWIVRMVVAGVLSVAMLRARSALCLLLLSLLSLLSLLCLLLGLGSRVGRRVAAVLGIGTGTKARLVVRATALRVLAQAVALGSIIACHTLLSIVLGVNALLLAKLLTIIVVGITVLLVRGIVVGVVSRRRAECTLGGRLSSSRKTVERGLRNGSSLLAEGIERLLGCSSFLGSCLAEAIELLGGRHGRLNTYAIR
jgi:hypothetical protein